MSANADEKPQSMLWTSSDDRQVQLPERQLLDAIASGELDQHLVAIADAVRARRELLHTVRSAHAIAQLCVGDTVMFNGNIRPRYLQHEAAGITALDERQITVRLWRRVGRFGDGEVRCPPLALQLVGSPHRNLIVSCCASAVAARFAGGTPIRQPPAAIAEMLQPPRGPVPA